MSRMVGQNIGKIAAPAVPAVIGVQTVPDPAVRGALHVHVERRVHAQTTFVHRFGAIACVSRYLRISSTKYGAKSLRGN